MESPSYLYSEVTVPTLLEQPNGAYSKKEISYLMKIEGVHRILHLYQKSFVIQNMPIYYLSLKGRRTVQHPKPRIDCYYSGYVEDLPNSDVVISTCNGLWGYVQIGNLTYQIQPIENFSGFKHLLYRKAPEPNPPCQGVVVEEMGLGARPTTIHAPEPKDAVPHFPGKNAPSRYLEYFAVCDHSVFQWAKQNVTQEMLMVLQILSVVHHVYSDIGLHVVLTGMEVWTEKDHLPLSKQFGERVQVFQHYANSELQRQTHFDHATLFTNVAQDDTFAKTWKLPECLQNQVSVSVAKISPSATDVGVSAAHQLGHALGFAHDDLPRADGRPCGCNSTTQAGHCLMHAATAERYALSNCSKETYFAFLQGPGRNCFLNWPKDVTPKKTCGNGVVEDGEQCDCGTDEQTCIINDCCQEDCQMKPGATCLQGSCCQECKLLTEGTVCREALSDCDLDEYCSGTSETCPPDVFKQNGMPCGLDSTCYSGVCLDIRRHCQTFFGKGMRSKMEMQLMGMAEGGGSGSRPSRDVSCGRLQCTNVHKIPRIPPGFSILQTPVEEVLCWSIISAQQDDGNDAGATKEGSSCGPRKICINRACEEMKVLNYDCDVSKCNNQGVCNSKTNCHCSYGWAPPHCSGRGFGGSVDSGPAPERVKSKKTLMLGSIIGVALLLLALTAMLKKFLPMWIRYGGLLRQKVSPEPMDSAFESTGSVAESMEESMEASAGKDRI
ncbi:disintegrin and metalloproteinase domain-containing protein 9-like [Protobothrops mucrosquamatus]|uniref:disintegrin and metalloproteinase domain-containing protein 9-like n=1 Tax=Protobothrops mucrosquamatus TaxID=103944 RepID=UPI0010FB7D31|nr:disintegrin and metalloproteinase domain-containing protein 9-like [Protobothrops mucrosquamatus]